MHDKLILFISHNFYLKLEILESLGNKYSIHTLSNGVEAYKWLMNGNHPDIIISDLDLPLQNGLTLLEKVRNTPNISATPFILLCDDNLKSNIELAKKSGANDIYLKPVNYWRMEVRIEHLLKIKVREANKNTEQMDLSLTSGKKILERIIGLFVFIILSPFLLLIAVLIKLESKGPVLNITSKVGHGYRKINDYKFRSIKWSGSWIRIKMNGENEGLYINNECPECQKKGGYCSPLLYIDERSICENLYFSRLLSKKKTNNSNDELTNLGKILRKTGLENLPNLLNVIEGKMSFIGMGMLLPEEAEKCTTDVGAGRFLKPVGFFVSDERPGMQ